MRHAALAPPQPPPLTRRTRADAIIAVGVVLVYSLSTWFFPGPKPFNARTWFSGPNLDGLAMDKVVDGGPGASVRGASEGLDVVVPPVPLGV